MVDKELEKLEQRRQDFAKRKAIEQFMYETYAKAKEMGCTISVNPKTRKMSWGLI